MNEHINAICKLIREDNAPGLMDYIACGFDLTIKDWLIIVDQLNPYYLFFPKPFDIELTGSGGSHIQKPNIGTIAAMYLSRVPGITVLKLGSRKRTSASGSTDLLVDLGYDASTDKVNFFKKWKFLALDTDECSKWRKYEGILRLNPSINRILDEFSFNEFNCKNKMTGTVCWDAAPRYASKKRFHDVGHWYIYGGRVGTKYIDEFVCGHNKLMDNGVFSDIIISENYLYNDSIDIIETNHELLHGTCHDDFWYISLEQTVSYSLWLSKVTNSLEDAKSIFKDIYHRKVLEDMLLDLKKQ